MVRNIAMAFIGLVLIFYVMKYPGQVVGLLQMFVDSAHHIANALGGLDTNGGK